MPYSQTKDVLDQARKFHRRLSGFYEDLKDNTSVEHTRALLDYMSRHEKYLDECLQEFKEQVSANVLDTFMQYGSDASSQVQIDRFEIKPEMTVDDVVAAAIEIEIESPCKRTITTLTRMNDHMPKWRRTRTLSQRPRFKPRATKTRSDHVEVDDTDKAFAVLSLAVRTVEQQSCCLSLRKPRSPWP